MDQQQQRGRGRARGRARGADPSAQAPRPGGSGQGPPPQRAWGGFPQPAPVVQTPQPWGPPAAMQQMQQQRAPAPVAAPVQQGRATYRRGAGGDAPGGAGFQDRPVGGAGGTSGASDAEGPHGPGGRGAFRGKRQIYENTIQTRPPALVTKKGTTGQAVRLSSNYFKLLQQVNWCLFQYRVDFAPEEDRTYEKKKMMRIALARIVAGYLFDGTVMYCTQRLNPDPMELVVQPEDATEPVRITIRLVGDVAMGDYHYLQVFNILMRKCMGHLKLQLVGRNFFDALAKVNIPEHRMEVWPGYVTSIRQHEQSILMCCEVTHKVMRNDTVFHLLRSCAEESSDYKRMFQERIIGAVVLTDYNNRTYRIDDVDWSTSPTSTFEMKDKTDCSYVQYYQKRYNIKLRDPKQPMLVSRAKQREIRAGMAEKVMLVPELCRMTGLTDQQRSNFTLMRALAEHTRVGPAQRIERLLRFNQRLTEKPDVIKELKEWNMELAADLVKFEGRVLPMQTIVGGNSQTYPSGRDVDWMRDLRSKPMLYSVEVKTWAIITPTRSKGAAQSFAQMIVRNAHGMQWRLANPTIYEIRDDRPAVYLEQLEEVYTTLKPQLILCVVSNNKADRYAAIKKKCCVDRACPTQVVLSKNLDSKNAMSIATKVAIQMNCKVGGSPWSVQIPLKNVMIVGYDVCHDTSQKGKSFGAMVASLDQPCTRYFSSVTAHTNGEELSNDFALNMQKALKEYYRVNNCNPERILIFRDGVGDGQLPYVIEHEVERIKTALGATYGDKLKLAFIVVSKRINTRIFTEGNNPRPGTVVDDCITLPERYDYFIVSQCVRQGTVAPTSYNVIFDNVCLSADHLQQLTYKLTHMYYNWSGTVRVPAPCQYAHKLAFLAGQFLHRTPHPDLQTVLYYL